MSAWQFREFIDAEGYEILGEFTYDSETKTTTERWWSCEDETQNTVLQDVFEGYAELERTDRCGILHALCAHQQGWWE